MVAALDERRIQTTMLMQELKEASLEIPVKVIKHLEPPRSDMVEIYVLAADSDRAPQLLANADTRSCMHGWWFCSQLRMSLFSSRLPHLTTTLKPDIGAEFDIGKILFTRLGADKLPIGEPMSVDNFVLDCVDGDLKIIEEDPRFRGRRSISFVDTDLLNSSN